MTKDMIGSNDCEICLGRGSVMVGMSFPPKKTIAVHYEYDQCPGCTPPAHTFHAKRTAQILQAMRNHRATVPLPVDAKEQALRELARLGQEFDAPEPTPGAIDLLCLSVQDVINGRLETGDAAADLAALKEHLDTALNLTGFDGENG